MGDALTDRRQRALEAGEDADDYPQYTYRSIETAIEVATQVKITDDIYQAFVEGTRYAEFRDGLIAAFRAAGFEVVE